MSVTVGRLWARCGHGASATLSTVQHQDDALAVAVDVFKRADASRERVTLGLVERRLAELAGHEPGCGCGVCAVVGSVTAAAVFWVAANWQNQIAVTRRRAVR